MRVEDKVNQADEANAAGAGALFLGIGVCAGVAVGRAFCRRHEDHKIVERDIAVEDVPREIARFESAMIATRSQLREIQKSSDPAVAGIFDAHLMILDDRPFIDRVIFGVENRMKNVEYVLSTVAHEFVQSLSKVQDDYLRERVADVNDVARRILRNLGGVRGAAEKPLAEPAILVADDLPPSEIVLIDKTKVLGIAMDLGSPTCHVAILAGKMGIPAVVGLHNFSAAVASGDEILLDGNKGHAILRPSAELLGQYDRIAASRRSVEISLRELKDQPSDTRDGCRIFLAANIEMPQDVDQALSSGADGVGLFRTEYFFMSRQDLPSEDEQFQAYRDVVSRLTPAPTVIRTLDLGGDKFLPNLDGALNESNPFMGWRAIRFCLAQPDLFKTQLRAILRASAFGNAKIMYPMISNVDEIVRANAILDQAKKELFERGYPFNPHIEVGAMIEVPSAAMIADLIAPHVSFFSLGTNDLIQYTLAIDRGNERVAYLYEPTHPAILRLIKHTADAGHRFGIWTGLCGGVGGDPLMTPLLVGLGLDELSVSPAVLPVVKDAIRSITYSEARDIADAALYSQSAMDVQEMSRELARKVAPEILELVV